MRCPFVLLAMIYMEAILRNEKNSHANERSLVGFNGGKEEQAY
jgi:hypothetical protein